MISEDRIMFHLNLLLESSEPGATLHHLHVLAAPVGPLGPVTEELKSSVYALDLAGDQIASVIVGAARENAEAGLVVVFAALAVESWLVESDRMDESAARLAREGRLREHPAVVEATAVYAVCRDGRRWRGRRFLTGPKAGQSEGVAVLVGAPRRGESQGVAVEPLMRTLVGMAG